MFCTYQPAKVEYFHVLYWASVTDRNCWKGQAQHKWEATPIYHLSRDLQNTKFTSKHPFPLRSGAVAPISSFWHMFPMGKVRVILISVMILQSWRYALLCCIVNIRKVVGRDNRRACKFVRSLLIHCSADSHSLQAIAWNNNRCTQVC